MQGQSAKKVGMALLECGQVKDLALGRCDEARITILAHVAGRR